MPSCPRCGAELRSDNPAGLCPQCLIEAAFGSSAGADDPGAQTVNPESAPTHDDDFGRYHIVRPVGEGGMGIVYLAEQRDPIRRNVALKVVKLGMDTSQVLARFANERQALAMMDHPNIARIFDADATRRGRPYFAMEYIDGESITAYCDSRRMTVGERVELFLAVCDGVEHAHGKGVIHRDLKPSNVLVTEQHGRPVPKVIDFGIAKATDQWAVEKTLLTEFGQMVGTPEYASPEQAELMTGEVDERSDVYSLGVLLYELLIGTPPFDPARLRQVGLSEMLRIIREEEAPPLWRKLMSLGAWADDIAACRQRDPDSLRRLVDGDLSWIAAKALEKRREQRYGSVAALTADLRRSIEHRPVLASPPGAFYRSRKFVRRHRVAVIGAAATIATIAVSALTVWPLLPPLLLVTISVLVGLHIQNLRARGRVDSTVRPATSPKGAVAQKFGIVLGEFSNATGEPVFDGTLRQIVAAEFRKSPDVTVLSDTRMTDTLRLMTRAPDTKFTSEVASEICERMGCAAVVDGSITRLGSQYVLRLRARDGGTGDVLDEQQTPAADKDDVFRALADMANLFRNGAGARLARGESQRPLPIEVTTPSLEAWKSYTAGMSAVLRRAKHAENVALQKRAIEIDPQFAMAYASMGRSYDSLGESELAAQNIGKAYALRHGVSDRENFFITFNYYRQVPRNLELARQTLESWAEKYPRDMLPHSFLSGFTSPGSGHHERAAEEGLKALAIDPDFSIGYFNVAFAFLYLNRVSDAEALLRKASQRKIEVAEFSLLRYFIAFLKGDRPAMDREVAERRQKLQAQGWFEHQEALTAAYGGRLKEAARLSDAAVRLSQQAGLQDRPAHFAGARAVWSALFGMRKDAQTHAAAALSLYRSRDADYGPAFALTLLHCAESHDIAAELESRFAEDTSVRFSYLPTLRALEALNHGNPALALEITQAAGPYDLAVPATAYFTGASFLGALYPLYVRGLAYLRLRRCADAAAEFQRILDYPGIILTDPIGPMTRLQLARSLSASGDDARSAVVYDELLNIWRNADSDVPVVQEARREGARQM